MPSMEYGYLGTDGKYVVTNKIFIVAARSVNRKKRSVRPDIYPLINSVIVQEPVLNHKLAAFVSIAVIKLFCVESQSKFLC